VNFLRKIGVLDVIIKKHNRPLCNITKNAKALAKRRKKSYNKKDQRKEGHG